MTGDTFGVIVRDATPGHCWYALVGGIEQIDAAFDWCALHLGRQTDGWFSILSHEQDAIFLDVHIFRPEINQIFERAFAGSYLHFRPQPESESARSPRTPSAEPDADRPADRA